MGLYWREKFLINAILRANNPSGLPDPDDEIESMCFVILPFDATLPWEKYEDSKHIYRSLTLETSDGLSS